LRKKLRLSHILPPLFVNSSLRPVAYIHPAKYLIVIQAALPLFRDV
jgi:hypothetical protein